MHRFISFFTISNNAALIFVYVSWLTHIGVSAGSIWSAHEFVEHCIYKILVIMPNWTVKSVPIYIPTNSICRGPLDFPVAQMVKNLPVVQGSVTGLRRSPGEESGYPHQYSCLENSMDRGAWQTSSWICKESDMTEWLTLSPLRRLSVFVNWIQQNLKSRKCRKTDKK